MVPDRHYYSFSAVEKGTRMNRIGRKATFGLALVVSLSQMLVAQAHVQEKTDPNDARGPVDLARATFAHPDDRVKSTLTTRGDWNAATLTNFTGLYFTYESRGNSFGDYYVKVTQAKGGGLQGELYEGDRLFDDTGVFVTNVNANRKGRKLIVKFPAALLKPRNNYIGWGAVAKWTGSIKCEENQNCIDVMPDGTFYRHNL